VDRYPKVLEVALERESVMCDVVGQLETGFPPPGASCKSQAAPRRNCARRDRAKSFWPVHCQMCSTMPGKQHPCIVNGEKSHPLDLLCIEILSPAPSHRRLEIFSHSLRPPVPRSNQPQETHTMLPRQTEWSGEAGPRCTSLRPRRRGPARSS